MIFRHVVYVAQFFFATIYKVGKCMMPSVLKICSDFKSCVVYSSLNAQSHINTSHEARLLEYVTLASFVVHQSVLLCFDTNVQFTLNRLILVQSYTFTSW